jgi:hypothetical protein
VNEAYAGKQIVGIDVHRRRSVLVRMTEAGQRLETVRISNDPEYLRAVMARAGEAPEVVLGSNIRLVLGRRYPGRAGRARALGTPAGREDVFLSAD